MSEEPSSHFVTVVAWAPTATVIAFFLGMMAWSRWKGSVKARIWMHRQRGRKALAGKIVPRAKAAPKATAVPMPSEHMRPPDRKLQDLAAGDTTYMEFTYVAVDESGATFVDLNSRVHKQPNIMSVKVLLDKDGCTLTLPKEHRHMTFSRHRLYSSSS
jgi:hypothetical protein